MSLLEEELPEDIRGRVFGVLNSLVSIFSFLPLIIGGPLADVWGIAPVFLLGALVVFGLWFAGRAQRERAGHASVPTLTQVTQPNDARASVGSARSVKLRPPVMSSRTTLLHYLGQHNLGLAPAI